MSKYPIIENMAALLKRGLTGVPMTAPVIPRNGGWSGDNQLGHIKAFQNNSRAQQTILKMDEWGPPVLWTVSFDIAERPDDDLLIADIVAQIDLGVGGSTQTLLCDWNVGNQVSVTANAINVIALYRTLSVGVNSENLKLSVQLARGSRPSSGIAPVFTFMRKVVLAATPGPGNADRADLPNFTKAIRLIPSTANFPGAAADVTKVYDNNVILSQLDAANNVIAVGRSSDYVTSSMPVVAGARFLRVDNLSASAIVFNAIAELAA